MAYSIERIFDEGDPVIVLRGDVDAGAEPSLQAAFAEVGASHDRVIVDLDAATLIDSRTIGLLAKWAFRLRDRGGSLPIVCGNPDVLRLIRRIGMDQAFDLYESRGELLGE